ncbi:RNA polymerase sigma factor [Megalodesulfovibrio paquesii]
MAKTSSLRAARSNASSSAPDLHACLAGDERAWSQLLGAYGPLIRKAVRWTLRNHPAKFAGPELEAEQDDIFQDICFRLVRSEYKLLRTYDPTRGSFATWLCVVARSAALDHLRNRQAVVQMSVEEMEALMEPCEDRKDAGWLLTLPGGLLSPRQQYVLHLLFEQDATTQEVAALMDVHPQTVRSLRNSALTRLRWHFYGNNPDASSATLPRQEVQRRCKAM